MYALTDLSQAAYAANHLDTAWSIIARGIVRPYRMAIMCPSAGTIGTALGDTAVQIVAFFGPAKVLGVVRGVGAATAGDAAAVAGETAELQGVTDFLDSSETGFLGGNLYGEENLAALGRYLANKGVDLLVGDRYLPRLPSGGRASGLFIVRAEGRPQLILGDNPTQYQVWHELLHYLHYRRIGRATYLGLPRSSAWNAAEQAVFDALEDPRRWFRLNEAEREHAIDYIENEGGGFR